ncbi:60S ribosome biogenesis protein Rrp14 [Coccidioides immitis RS]|uniref:60S ribosome biogenesis protein Rrp14 n=2 Tax=Coccidioides immitis TaxID=5501 RepID=J3KCK3_COCIM|nr:60S ribosome biogenesis protein Rrp14 [Coccidioides immitis RS]EAS32971.3 60S ribosome biogenesis protein Rrp14 [Coccidioides immitis RS]KMP08246.1 hypothetical protein CIRG_07927 [Coccidioides immitis RMSCC 2394]TPX19916.1 hypothetical protein DIZ76_017711 [Coccidioides immitis]
MADSLEERLRSHANAFDGLLSLIPAKYYYGQDTSDQWQRKKQTKEQARNAKRAKLDPDAAKSAKDVMDENARKRKREDGQLDTDDGELGSEKPLEGLNRGDYRQKKQKKGDSSTDGHLPESTNDSLQHEKEERLKQKQEKKAAKQEKKKQKAAEKTEKRKQKQRALEQSTKASTHPITSAEKPDATASSADDASDDEEVADEMAPVEGFSGEKESNSESTAPTSPAADSNPFDTSKPPSGTSSTSSVVPPTENDGANKNDEQKSNPKPLKPTSEELKQRLQKRLDELRAARHADGFNGKPAKNRQELIEARRQREEQRRAHKKEMRQKAKEEEQRLRDEAIAKRFSPKGSLLVSPGSPAESITSITNNFSFGRVVFADGQTADPSLSTLRNQKKQKGPQDTGTALKAAEAKQTRLAGLDEKKKAEIEEKDMWLNAKKRAHGEKVKDDVSLLKKALNRKEGTKKKSEKQWKERIEGVAKSREARQAKREENIRKRKEEKGNKGKKGKPKARPGFEGRFKTKVGGKKK